ncbi:MAG: hypothetical protein IPP85_06210 [Propionivibrio sp.]|nr:hypothetical protein [Propionivibrio sp.]
MATEAAAEFLAVSRNVQTAWSSVLVWRKMAIGFMLGRFLIGGTGFRCAVDFTRTLLLCLWLIAPFAHAADVNPGCLLRRALLTTTHADRHELFRPVSGPTQGKTCFPSRGKQLNSLEIDVRSGFACRAENCRTQSPGKRPGDSRAGPPTVEAFQTTGNINVTSVRSSADTKAR